MTTEGDAVLQAVDVGQQVLDQANLSNPALPHQFIDLLTGLTQAFNNFERMEASPGLANFETGKANFASFDRTEGEAEDSRPTYGADNPARRKEVVDFLV